MYKATQELDAAHPHGQAVSLNPGSKADHLEHASCNRSAGNETRTPLSEKARLDRAQWTTRDWGLVAPQRWSIKSGPPRCPDSHVAVGPSLPTTK